MKGDGFQGSRRDAAMARAAGNNFLHAPPFFFYEWSSLSFGFFPPLTPSSTNDQT
jgi:hypothetical protein